MQTIIATIKPGDTGNAVTNLQDALLALLKRQVVKVYDIPNRPTADELQKLADLLKQERAKSSFGEGTTQLIRHFQIQQSLGDHLYGVVEVTTAEKLNALLQAFGMLDSIPAYHVDGRITFMDGSPAANIMVRAHDRDDGNHVNFLGEALSDMNGNYRISYQESDFRKSPAERGGADVFIEAWNPDTHLLQGSSKVHRNAKSGITINLKIERITHFTRGVINDTNGKPVPNVLVRLFECDLRTEQSLGEAVTGKDGRYEISFGIDQFIAADNTPPSPDLRISVYDPQQNLLAQSDILFNAGTTSAIDLVISVAATSEWEHIRDQVLPLLNGQAEDGQTLPPWSLTETDLQFIVKDTGLDQAQLRLWVLAASMAKGASLLGTVSSPQAMHTHLDTNINASQEVWDAFAMLYGWLRMDMPQDFTQLIQQPTGVLLDAYEQAVTRRFIPAMSQKLMDKLRTALEQRRIEEKLKPAKAGAAATLGDLLDIMPGDWLTPANRKKIVLLLDETSHKADDFLDQARAKGLSKTHALKLRQVLQLAELSLNHAPLIKVLRTVADQDAKGTLTPLAALPFGQWLEWAFEHGVPPNSGMSQETYATHLANNIETRYPSQTLVAQLQNRSIQFQPEEYADVLNILVKHPHLDISTDDIAQFSQDKKIKPETASALAALQRLKKLNAQWSEVEILVNANIQSIEDITRFNKLQFQRHLENSLPYDRTGLFHERATHQQATGIGMMSYLFPYLYGMDTTVHGGKNRLKKSGAQKKINASPTLRKLFGALDNCACDPCLSVLSPSAYLADLLKFVDASPTVGRTLRQRRPDIFDLKLSCDNANTELPHIDLAIEILENAVAFPYRVALPPGTLFSKELSDGKPVGPHVRQSIAKTTLDRPDNLTAHTDDGSIKSLKLVVGAKDWTVSDAMRTWYLHSQEEYFGLLGTKRVPINANNQLQAFIRNLNNGKPSASFKKVLYDALESSASAVIPLNVVDAKISDISGTDIGIDAPDGQFWDIDFLAAGEITIALNGSIGMIVLKSADGKKTVSRQLNAPLLIEIGKGLNQGQLSELLQQTLAGTQSPGTAKSLPGYVVKRVTSNANNWKYTYQYTAKVTLAYLPASVEIRGLSYQSSETDRDLFTRPQNLNPLAYEKLASADACFPWSLPFDFELEGTRAALNVADASRTTLIAQCTSASQQYTSVAIAREKLGLTSQAWHLIADSTIQSNGSTDSRFWRIWGMVPGTQTLRDTFTDQDITGVPFGADGLLTRISIVLQQSRLKHTELLQLLECEFINPNGAISITPDYECQPSNMRFSKGAESELAPVLDRLHRFVRLWRITGWKIPELDLALTTVCGGTLDNDALTDIANLDLLRSRTGLSIEVLSVMLGGFSNKRYLQTDATGFSIPASLYDRLFQNRQLFNPPPEKLTFGSTLNTLDSETGQKIATSLGIPQSELSTLLQSPAIDPHVDFLVGSTTPGKNALLQWVFRNVTLPRVLGITSAEYEIASRLLPSGFFASTAQILSFIDHVSFVKNSGFTWGDLDYLLLGSPSENHLPDQQVYDELNRLQDDLYQIQLVETDTSVIAKKRQDLIIQRLTEITSIDLSTTLSIVQNLLHTPGNTPQSAMDYFTSDAFVQHALKERFEDTSGNFDLTSFTQSDDYYLLSKLHRIAALNAVWKFSSDQLSWFCSSTGIVKGVFNGLTPDQLPPSNQSGQILFMAWMRSARIFSLAQSEIAVASAISTYLEALNHSDTSGSRVGNKAKLALADTFDLLPESINTACRLLGIAALSDFQDPISFSQLFALLSTMQRLRLTGENLEVLIGERPGQPGSDIGIHLLQTRFDTGTWKSAVRRISDNLRILKRDRLVDYLLARDHLANENTLYEHYLIDVEMQPCMNTTRLLQATAAVQMFVHRCFLNLEPQALGDTLARDRWEWMQNYRVWEANRKVFLYPENWLFPELRDDQTEIFKRLGSSLTSSEPTQANAVNALSEYLDHLAEVNQITIMGMFEYSTSSASDTALYLVGRSQNPPYSFYWRKAVRFGTSGTQWTGWGKIELELSEDHLIPFVLDNELFVAWPVIKTIEKDDGIYHRVQMAWSQLTRTGWTKRQISQDFSDEIKALSNRDVRSLFSFQCQADPTSHAAIISAYRARPKHQSEPEPLKPNVATQTKLAAQQSGLKNQPWFLTITLFCFVKYKSGRIAKMGSTDLKLHGLQAMSWAGTSESNPYKNYSGYGPVYAAAAAASSVDFPGQSYFFSSKMVPGSYTLVVEVTSKEFTATPVTLQLDPFSANQWDTVIFTANILFTDVEEPDVFESDPTVPLDMERFATYIISTRDEATCSNAEGGIIKPLANSFYWSSGFKERGTGGIAFIKSDFSEQIVLRLAGDAGTLSNMETWYVEEGHRKLIMQLEERNFVNRLYPAGYSESLLYKSLGQVPDLLFNEESQTKGANAKFGVEDIDHWIGHRHIQNDPRDNIDLAFDLTVPNACYNWEVFFHLPLKIARHFSSQLRFEDARKWFHYIFDPTTGSSVTGPERYWQFLPFRNMQTPDSIESMLERLSQGANNSELHGQIEAWLNDPFNPFAIARLRNGAFAWSTVIAYIQNLIAWGDQLYRRDTREAINEATVIYVLAAQILGPRPQETSPSRASARTPMSYRELNSGKLDDFGNLWVDLATSPLQAGNSQNFDVPDLDQVASVGSLYFCVPPNEKLPDLWNTVEDRLFKIRHCRNIEGVTRSLPLYEPPIDPELLIRAKAAGLELADILNDSYAPLPNYRFQYLLQKANELCNEVKGLGSAILSAIEKKESEHLALLRSSQEISMLKLVESIKKAQIEESQANLDALRKTRSNTLDRFVFLQRLLGRNEQTFDATNVPIVEDSFISQVQLANVYEGFQSLALIYPESEQIHKMEWANNFSIAAGIARFAAGAAHLVALNPVAKPTAEALGFASSAVGDALGTIASQFSYEERRFSQMAGWQRRRDEWVQQSRITAEEIRQIDKQIIALEIRKSIAEKELENHRKQIEHASTIDDYLRHLKFTGESLYVWMESQLAGLYFTAYQMAYELAKKAEKSYQFELGDQSSTFVRYGHWDNLHQGLLSGERLGQDLRRLESAHLDKNKRELEITKHISLRQLDPLALMKLRQDGSCDFEIPEILFDLDFPGHYFRRIKNVSISVPCIVGPYTSVGGTLTLKSNKLRTHDQITGAYNDPNNYVSNRISCLSVATSSGQNDSGMFEMNFRDERYLPFEGAGVISDWTLELPKQFRPFDYDTISDVVMHIRYTARAAANGNLAEASTNALKTNLNKIKAHQETDAGLWLLIDLKHDYPAEWQKNRLHPAQTVIIRVGRDRFPFLLQGQTITPSVAKLLPVDEKRNITPIADNEFDITLNGEDFSGDNRQIAVRYTI